MLAPVSVLAMQEDIQVPWRVLNLSPESLGFTVLTQAPPEISVTLLESLEIQNLASTQDAFDFDGGISNVDYLKNDQKALIFS